MNFEADTTLHEAMDPRDGLSPSLRRIFSILQANLPENKFRRSSKVLQAVVAEIPTDWTLVYDTLVDTTWPRCELPLVDGLGLFAFPVAHPEFSEIRFSSFFTSITKGEQLCNFNLPLCMPVPYALAAGTLGYSHSHTKIPSHNLREVIDATIALIQSPNLSTEDLLQYIKGPDLLVGGAIENSEELPNIYESGTGVIKVVVTPQTLNTRFFSNAKQYSLWYEMKARKVRGKDAIRIEIPYHALMSDGISTRLMSLKEILQSYIDHFKSCNEGMTDEVMCALLSEFKDKSSSRMTQPGPSV